MTTNWSLVAALALLVVVGVVFFAKSTALSSVPAEQVLEEREPQTLEYDVRVSAAGWSPSTIEAYRFDTVVLRIRSTDGEDYDFTLPVAGVQRAVPFGEEVEVVFEPEIAGAFEFYSSLPGSAGVRGELHVKE